MSGTEQVRDVEGHYLGFLWRQILEIRKAQALGDYSQGLDLAVTLISISPGRR